MVFLFIKVHYYVEPEKNNLVLKVLLIFLVGSIKIFDLRITKKTK